MPLDISLQIHIVIYSLLAGIIIGGLFDLYRIVRGNFEQRAIIIIQDILFWILCALVIFVFLLYKNYGFFMPYVYLFMGLALVFYLKLISPVIFNFELLFTSWIKTIIRVGFKHISYPVRILWAKIGNKK